MKKIIRARVMGSMKKHMALWLLGVAFGTICVGLVLNPVFGQNPLVTSSAILILVIMGAGVISYLTPFVLAFHIFLYSVLIRAVDAKKYGSSASMVAASLLLNLSYLAVVQFVSPQSLAESVPGSSLIMKTILESKEVFSFFQSNYVWFMLLIGSSGPATIYAIRYYRAKNQNAGKAILRFLQLLLYLSVVILILAFTRMAFTDSQLNSFKLSLWVFVLPTTFVASALFLQMPLRLSKLLETVEMEEIVEALQLSTTKLTEGTVYALESMWDILRTMKQRVTKTINHCLTASAVL